MVVEKWIIFETNSVPDASNKCKAIERCAQDHRLYVCDYMEYMDELKGYYYSSDYEEKAKEKTFKQLLDERCVYSEKVSF